MSRARRSWLRGPARGTPLAAPLALLAYVVIRGCDASVLKWLQERGTATLLRTGGADDPISFGN